MLGFSRIRKLTKNLTQKVKRVPGYVQKYTMKQYPQQKTPPPLSLEQMDALNTDLDEPRPQLQRPTSAKRPSLSVPPQIIRAKSQPLGNKLQISEQFLHELSSKKKQIEVIKYNSDMLEKYNEIAQKKTYNPIVNTNRSEIWKDVEGVFDICEGISDDNETLRRNMNMYGIKQTVRKIPFTIFPYCNENIKISKHIDSVNASSISENTINVLNDTLNLEIQEYDPRENISTDISKKVYQRNNPKKFFATLPKLNNNYIIASHGTFMRNFYKYLLDSNDKIKNLFESNIKKFQNLDVIHLIFKDRKLIQFYYRLFKDDYDLKIPYNITEDENVRHVFIIRHCVGCHNLQSHITDKITQGVKETAIKNKKGYLSHAMCIKPTVTEITEKKQYLINLFNRFGGLETYRFGSSIIFRAIVTGGLLYNILYDNTRMTSHNSQGRLRRRGSRRSSRGSQGSQGRQSRRGSRGSKASNNS